MPGKRESAVLYENTRLADYTYDDSIERGPVDAAYTLLTLILLAVGVIMVLSASFARAYYDVDGETGGSATYYFARQGLFALLGVGIMFACSRFPMGFYRRLSWPLMLGSMACLALVLVVGTKTNGSKRWIDLGFTTFQPSEIAKIAIIMYFAALLCRSGGQPFTLKSLVPYVLILGGICLLLGLEPHVSAAIIILAIGLVLLFVGGLPMKWVVGGVGASGVLFALAYWLIPHVRNRISAWLNPFADASDTGYQVVQSLYAIGSGGLTGLGLGNSRQKYLYLPEEHNDYIFSIVCEELGFIGAILILALFAMFIIRGYWIACHARDKYSLLVGVGITTHFALQIIMNVAVCTNTMPSTGISLPLFSYGGTALLLQMAEIGIMLSISRDISEKR